MGQLTTNHYHNILLQRLDLSLYLNSFYWGSGYSQCLSHYNEVYPFFPVLYTRNFPIKNQVHKSSSDTKKIISHAFWSVTAARLFLKGLQYNPSKCLIRLNVVKQHSKLLSLAATVVENVLESHSFLSFFRPKTIQLYIRGVILIYDSLKSLLIYEAVKKSYIFSVNTSFNCY